VRAELEDAGVICSSAALENAFGPEGASLWHNATEPPASNGTVPAARNGTASNGTDTANGTAGPSYRYPVIPGSRLRAGECAVILLGGREGGVIPAIQALLPRLPPAAPGNDAIIRTSTLASA